MVGSRLGDKSKVVEKIKRFQSSNLKSVRARWATIVILDLPSPRNEQDTVGSLVGKTSALKINLN